jgi:hypothetical protein
LVVPIGTNNIFSKQFHVVARERDLPLYELSRPSRWKSAHVFNYNVWNRGSLIFDYLKVSDPIVKSVDKTKVLQSYIKS